MHDESLHETRATRGRQPVLRVGVGCLGNFYGLNERVDLDDLVGLVAVTILTI